MDYNLPEDYHALVLLIDDQTFVSDAVHRAFMHQRDIDYHYCPDAREALAIANRIRPTVILLDLVMPGVSGLTLLKELRKSPYTRETPIVVLSSKEEAHTKSEAFALGANDYLVKLPDTVELRARVRYHTQAYLNRIQREEAFRALKESQQQLVKKNAELHLINQDYEEALEGLREMEKMLPVCRCCKKFRDDVEYRGQLSRYLAQSAHAIPFEGLCPDCRRNQQENGKSI